VKEIVREGLWWRRCGREELAASRLFALTGYHPDYDFIEALGVRLDPESKRPSLNPNTLESNVQEFIWQAWWWRDAYGRYLLRMEGFMGTDCGGVEVGKKEGI